MLTHQATPELMTPKEAARWFRRSTSWIRQQRELLRLGGPGGQPLYHVRACRAYLLALTNDCPAAELRRLQLEALASECGLEGFGGAGGSHAAPGGTPAAGGGA